MKEVFVVVKFTSYYLHVLMLVSYSKKHNTVTLFEG